MASDPAQDAAASAAEQLQDLLKDSDVDSVKQLQLLILGRLQDSTAVLSHFNDFSERSYAAVVNDFARNTRMLKSMKADLDHIFRRIRNLKSRIASQFPDAFHSAAMEHVDDTRPDLEQPR